MKLGLISNIETAGRERTKLCKIIALSIKELFKNPVPDGHSADAAACIAMSLEKIFDGIDDTVAAWEKRNFWKKAERFRMEWEWTGSVAKKLSKALLEEDWSAIAANIAQTAQKVQNVAVSDKHRLGTPWDGAYKQFRKTHG